jgi:hypothetical protein
MARFIALPLVLPAMVMAIGSDCPAHLVQMASFNYTLRGRTTALVACEDLSSGNGSITFTVVAGAPSLDNFPLVLQKRVESNQPEGSDTDERIYISNYTKRAILEAETDVMGNMLLGIHGNSPRKLEVTLDEVKALGIPPLRSISSVGNGIPRIFTAGRESGRDVTFDASAYNHLSGNPTPQQAARLLPGIANNGITSTWFHSEGLIGGDLPMILLNFPVNNSYQADDTQLRYHCDYYGAQLQLMGGSRGDRKRNKKAAAVLEHMASLGCSGYSTAQTGTATTVGLATPASNNSQVVLWEMSVVPQANGTGFEQPVFIRFMQVNRSSSKGLAYPSTLYFDSMVYQPSKCSKQAGDGHSGGGDDTIAGCDPPSNFFAAVLDNHYYWQDVWTEGTNDRMVLKLPGSGTAGGMSSTGMSSTGGVSSNGVNLPLPTARNGCFLLNNTDINPHTAGLGNVPRSNAGECCTLCASPMWINQGCRFFVFSRGQCWFKTNADNKVPTPGKMSGRITGPFPTPPPTPPTPPPPPGKTDGTLLQLQAQHSLLVDMTTRSGGVWPRYGTYPGYDQPDDGQEEILTASMMAALEWGLFQYAHDVLDNYLTYFVRDERGSILYRGLEMAQQGRILTVIAQYYRYTGDAALLLKHLKKIDGVAGLLRQRRQLALTRYPSAKDSRHGIPTGIDEADLWWAATGSPLGSGAELPFVSIGTEMWRGFRDCGEALADIASTMSTGYLAPRTNEAMTNERHSAGTSTSGFTPLAANATKAEVVAVAKRMTDVESPLLQDLRNSVARDASPGNSSIPNASGIPRCFAYVAGVHECGMLPASLNVPSSRASEPWRTYAEMLYSGALEPETVREIVAWHQTQQGGGVRGSRLKLGVLAGAGSTVANGDSFESFTLHGWGYGLLVADLVEAFLLQYFAVSAHAYTRGTWIAPESVNLDRNSASPPYCTPAGLTTPIYLKWMLLFEEPAEHVLWVGKAVPRVWFNEGEVVEVQSSPTAYGRVSFRFSSAIDSAGKITANVTLPKNWATNWAISPRASPPGGVRVRVRAPPKTTGAATGSSERRTMMSVTAGGKPWTAVNATEEVLVITNDQLTDTDVLERLQSIVITYAR